jgi:DNA-binding transcriptional ArsR family regulator
MVESSAARLDRVFRALSDPTRRAIVRRLEQGPGSVTELAEPFDMSLAAVSKHVRVLEQAGIVLRTWRGATAVCRLHPTGLREAESWLGHYRMFWEAGLERLAEYAEPKAEGDER